MILNPDLGILFMNERFKIAAISAVIHLSMTGMTAALASETGAPGSSTFIPTAISADRHRNAEIIAAKCEEAGKNGQPGKDGKPGRGSQGGNGGAGGKGGTGGPCDN